MTKFKKPEMRKVFGLSSEKDLLEKYKNDMMMDEAIASAELAQDGLTEQQLPQLHEEYVDLQVVKVYLKKEIKKRDFPQSSLYLINLTKEIDKRQDEIKKIMSKNV
jgi:hypothetical protein